MAIVFKQIGSFKQTNAFLNALKGSSFKDILERYGAIGVEQLQLVTPVDSGLTQASWSYEVKRSRSGYTLSWHNTNVVGDIPIVILIQYGHGTRGGSYVQGRDIVNPAIQPIFDKILDDIRKEVNSL